LEVCEANELLRRYYDERNDAEIFELQMHGYLEEANRRIIEADLRDFHRNRKQEQRNFEWNHKPFIESVLKQRQNGR